MSYQPRNVVPLSECLPDVLKPERVRAILDRPFPPEAIKTRPGNFGQTLSYVEAHEYIRRLNEAFGVAWSFDVVQHEVMENEVLVVGKLTALGFVKMAFGGSQVTRVRETGEVISIADDLKAAATDSFKKCCSILGLGLHLYGEPALESKPQGGNEFPPPSGQKQTPKPGNGNGSGNGNGNGRLSAKQLSYILSLGQDKGMDYAAVKAKTMQIFNRVPEFLTKSEASTVIQEFQAL
jgi:hypothetical protein